ncbi:hypothetical protein ALMP_15130 [Streptomyces sp. A012304]|nr:hypothetical protein ALMP_15130 [Streptomyces sp. A012304]
MVAAIEYAGALPATAITTVSNVPRAFDRSPLLLLPMVALLSVVHTAGAGNGPAAPMGGGGWCAAAGRRGMTSGHGRGRARWAPSTLRRGTVTPSVRVMIAKTIELSRLTDG